MAIFIEREEYEFMLKCIHFCERIDQFVSLLGLDPVEVNDFKRNSDLFSDIFTKQDLYTCQAESLTKYQICQLQTRLSGLIYTCKCSQNYTVQIGNDLGISTPASAVENCLYTPRIRIAFTRQGYPVLIWEKGVFDEFEIWKNSGSCSGYQKLARTNKTIYIDKNGLPNKCEVWKYSAIFLFHDEMTGNWSDEVKISVQKR